MHVGSTVPQQLSPEMQPSDGTGCGYQNPLAEEARDAVHLADAIRGGASKKQSPIFPEEIICILTHQWGSGCESQAPKPTCFLGSS